MMPPSPEITHFSWGKLTIEGEAQPFKDACLFPGGAQPWDWRLTGTAHNPGIQPADVEPLLAHGATVIILSRGVLSRLNICPETLQLLKQKGVAVHILNTVRAVKQYNKLRITTPIGALIHSTC